jgi:hypothetical protein
MAFTAQVLAGMTVFQTACVLKVSFHAMLSQTFGCSQRTESMSILLFMSMIWQLLWLIRRDLWMYWRRSTSLSSREPEQLLFTLAATSFVIRKAPKKYIEKMMMGYKQMFGEKPSTKVHSPLEKGDHPELDTLELLDLECSSTNHLLGLYNGLFCLDALLLGSGKTTWRIGVLVWPKMVWNHHYKIMAQVWLLV